MRTPLNVSHLFYDKLPISPAYAATNHSGYEYLRDHLGYRLELESATWPDVVALNLASGSTTSTPMMMHPFTFSATLRNWGFAAPVNPRPVYLVVMSPDKRRILWRSHSLADPRDWQPYTPGDPFYTPQRHRFGATNLTIASANVEKYCPGSKPCALPLGLYLPDARPGTFAANVASCCLMLPRHPAASCCLILPHHPADSCYLTLMYLYSCCLYCSALCQGRGRACVQHPAGEWWRWLGECERPRPDLWGGQWWGERDRIADTHSHRSEGAI